MTDFRLHHIVRQPRQTAGGPAPLLILLHGVGSNEQDLMGLAPHLDSRFFLLSARAPIALGPSSFGWYHVQFLPNGFLIDEEEADRSRELLLHFVDEVTDRYPVDPNRIYLMGFSQGCIMSIGAVLTAPEKFAGAVGMSGRLLDSMLRRTAAESRLRNLPLMLVHGTEDSVIPVEHARATRDELQRLPVDLTWREYEMAHHVTSQSMGDIAEWLKNRLDTAEDWRSRRG